jgi:uncharacterized protein YggT (Ycf19 family)
VTFKWRMVIYGGYWAMALLSTKVFGVDEVEVINTVFTWLVITEVMVWWAERRKNNE